MKKYAEYKPSGIQWIGDIPSHWEVKKMNYTCSQITDFVASGSFADLKNNVEYLDEPDYAMLVRTADLSCKGNIPPVYVSKESYAFLSNSNLFGGEIILPNIGSVGDVYLVPCDLYPYMTLAPNAIMVNTQCNKFFYYFFSSKCGRDGLADISQGTTQSKFNKTQLRALKVIVPSLVEQEAIVKYLDKKCGSIDAVIAMQERRIALLSELKQSIITEAVTRGINPDAPLKDSGIEWIGKIPQHWEFFVTDHSDGIWGNEEQGNSDDISCLRIADFLYEYLSINSANPTIRNIFQSQLAGKLLKMGDLLIEKSGGGETTPVGRVVIYNSELKAVCSNFIHFARLNSKICSKYLCYYFCFLYANRINLLFFNQTTGLQNLKVHEYLGQAAYLPPLSEQEAIVEYLDTKCSSIDAAIGKAKREIELLREFKQSVITEAVTGKIKVY